MNAPGPPAQLPDDFLDLFDAFLATGVDFLVVGSYALARHGYVRATLDLDVLVRPSAANAARVVAALTAYGAPLSAHGVTAQDFERPGTVYELGVPPLRIDVLSGISGVTFDEAWESRVEAELGELTVPVIGREALLRNKCASGRPKDLADVEELERRDRDGGSAD